MRCSPKTGGLTLWGENILWTLNILDHRPKKAAFCEELAKRSLEKAEQKLSCVIVGFVSDNAAKMVKLREELAKWRNLMVYGCSAHELNLFF